jgi:hypothetical protein
VQLYEEQNGASRLDAPFASLNRLLIESICMNETFAADDLGSLALFPLIPFMHKR